MRFDKGRASSGVSSRERFFTPLFFRPFIFGVSFIVLTNSCGLKENLSRRLATGEQDVLSEQIGYYSGDAPTGTNLTWSQALSTLTKQNSQLRRGRVRLEDLERDRKRFYWNKLGPRLTGVVNLSAALDELSSLTSEDVSVQVFGNLQIPQPFTVYAERYALELSYYTAVLDFEDFRRQITADLYEVFLAQKALDQQIAESKSSLSASVEKDLTALLSDKIARTSDLEEVKQKQQAERIRQRLNALLDTPGRHWNLQPASLPKVDYDRRYKSLSFQNGFGRLGLRQSAARIEASRANLWRVKINRLPSLRLNANLPTLYSSTSDRDPQFEDIRLFSGLNKSLTFDDSRARSLRSAEERARSTRVRISLQLDREATRLKELKRRFADTLRTQELLVRRKQILRRSPPPALPNLLITHIQELNNIEDDLYQAKATKNRLALEFWIWDEAAWVDTQRQVQ